MKSFVIGAKKALVAQCSAAPGEDWLHASVNWGVLPAYPGLNGLDNFRLIRSPCAALND